MQYKLLVTGREYRNRNHRMSLSSDGTIIFYERRSFQGDLCLARHDQWAERATEIKSTMERDRPMRLGVLQLNNKSQAQNTLTT